MIEPKWQKRPIRIFRRTVLNELINLGMDLWDIVEILEEGFDCERSPRKQSIIERCVQKGRKIVKVVIEEGEETFQKKHVKIWVLRHVGEFTNKKRRWKK